MQEGRQWIHFDAQFPLGFGHDLCVKFGPAGQLLLGQSPGQAAGPQRGGEPSPGAPRIMIRKWRHVEEGY